MTLLHAWCIARLNFGGEAVANTSKSSTAKCLLEEHGSWILHVFLELIEPFGTHSSVHYAMIARQRHGHKRSHSMSDRYGSEVYN